MPLYDYRCDVCRRLFEVFLHLAQLDNTVLCSCGERAHRVLLRAPGFNGKNKGKFPQFDIQSGQTFESSKDRDDYAYKRGRFENRQGPKFEMQGPEEWKRSRDAPRTPDPMDSDEPDPVLIEIAKRAWDDVKYDRVPKEVEEERVMDVVKDCDFLDVNAATKPSGA